MLLCVKQFFEYTSFLLIPQKKKKKVKDYMFLLGFCAQAKIRGLYAVTLLDGIKNAINEEGRSRSNKQQT